MSKTIKVTVPNITGIDKEALLKSVHSGNLIDQPVEVRTLLSSLLEQVLDETPSRRGPKSLGPSHETFWRMIEAIKEYERRIESGDIFLNRTDTKEQVAKNNGLSLSNLKKALTLRKGGYFRPHLSYVFPHNEVQFVLKNFEFMIAKLIYELERKSTYNRELAEYNARKILIDLDLSNSKTYIHRVATSKIDISIIANCRNELDLIRLIRTTFEQIYLKDCQDIY